MTRITIEKGVVAETIALLRYGGFSGKETVLLWLGNGLSVHKVFRPQQIATIRSFRIPPDGMRGLMKELRQGKLTVVAQVHSHPGRAFHSRADDEWAVARHVGALSLVVPYFGQRTEVPTFSEHAVAYEMDEAGVWQEMKTVSCLNILSGAPQ